MFDIRHTIRKTMMSRNLAIALLVSLSAHVFWMSAVTIITPEGVKKPRVYTRVDFLGPILKKTAFDIMLENVNPLVATTYRYGALEAESGYLEVTTPKRRPAVWEFSRNMENRMDGFVLDFLTGTKAVPGSILDLQADDPAPEEWGRKVIYRPEPPFLTRGAYGDEKVFSVKIKVLVAAGGNVRETEPLTTTGYPQFDLIASKFVRGWIFEPRANAAGEDEWHVVDVILTTGD